VDQFRRAAHRTFHIHSSLKDTISTKNGAGTAKNAQEWWAVPIDKPGPA